MVEVLTYKGLRVDTQAHAHAYDDAHLACPLATSLGVEFAQVWNANVMLPCLHAVAMRDVISVVAEFRVGFVLPHPSHRAYTTIIPDPVVERSSGGAHRSRA
jgi:hypothetical protein